MKQIHNMIQEFSQNSKNLLQNKNITIFSAPKPFTKNVSIIQYNAIKSWTLLTPRPEIILIGNEHGIEEISKELGTRHIPDVQRNNSGTPLIRSIFTKAQESATNHILVYVNADIILLNDLIPAIITVSNQMNSYLIVGQRWDVDIDFVINFNTADWETKLRVLTKNTGRIHEPTGIDYFVFNKNTPIWKNFPDFAVGRIAWDNISIYNALQLSIPVIDATTSIFAIHQNHDYNHLPDKNDIQRKGVESNTSRKLVGNYEKIRTIKDANWHLSNNNLRPKTEDRNNILKREVIDQKRHSMPIKSQDLFNMDALTFSKQNKKLEYGHHVSKTFTKRYYCTYFDRNYLAKGMALIESLEIYEKKPYEMIIICLDKTTLNILNLFNYKNVQTILIHEIEKNDPALQQAKSNRSLIEYYWTLTPTILLKLFERYPWIRIITYLDADLFFYASPDPIYNELDDYSVMIHEHRFSPEQKYLERNGKFNTGLVCFRNDTNGIETLNWWRNQCNEWCYHRLEDGKFGDQLYLNQFPIRFNGVAFLQNIGAGVAPWNHMRYEFSEDDNGKKWVNNSPLIFYHFHSLEIVYPEVVIPSCFFPATPLTEDIIRICFEPYAEQLYKNYQKLKSINDNFTFGLKKTDQINIFLAHQSILSNIKIVKGVYNTVPISKKWFLFTNFSLSEKKIYDLLNEAEHEEHHGNTINALNLLLKVVKKDPENAVALNNLGVIHCKNGDKRQAICYLNKAQQYGPHIQTIAANLLRIKNETATL